MKELSPAEVAAKLGSHSIVLVDVREPQEYAAERIHGALLFPLSTFDPAALPLPHGRDIVFQCGSGKRSATAIQLCQASGYPHAMHLKGGLQSWKAAGLPTISLDAATGRPMDRR